MLEREITALTVTPMCSALVDSSMLGNMPKCIAVGWSGGIDSTALLLGLHDLGFKVQAWHIDHAWHSDSAEQAVRLSKQAELWGIPFLSKRLKSAPSCNREAHARRGRYKAFQSMAKETGVGAIALAHHADDQAETVCMRMLQGAGVMGMRGIQEIVQREQLTLYRPLLHVHKRDLERMLSMRGISYIEDKSNQDTTLWRNHIRLKLFPAMQAAGVQPQQFFMRWQKQAIALSNTIENMMSPLVFKQSQGCCSVDWDAWQALLKPVRAEVLQRMMANVMGKGVVLGRRHIELIEFWQSNGGKNGLDLSGCRLSRMSDCLHLEAKKASSCI